MHANISYVTIAPSQTILWISKCLKVDALIALMNCKNICPTLVPYVEENHFFAKNHTPTTTVDLMDP